MLKHCIGEEISTRLRNGTKVSGKLIAYDEHVNLMLQDTEIIRNSGEREEKKLMYLRGDSVMLVGQK